MTATAKKPHPAPLFDGLTPVARENYTARVYETLRAALFEGRLQPGQRLKIRALAAAIGVSETPVREALMQLLREKGLTLVSGRSLVVTHLTLAQYLELREIRLLLEGLAGELAAARVDADDLAALARAHDDLIGAEEAGRAVDANRANWAFHHRIYKAAGKAELLALIEGVWLRTGPLLNYLYPDARPTYPGGRHRHLDIIDGLKARDPAQVRAMLQADMVEGGAGLVRVLAAREAAEQNSSGPAKRAGEEPPE